MINYDNILFAHFEAFYLDMLERQSIEMFTGDIYHQITPEADVTACVPCISELFWPPMRISIKNIEELSQS